MLVAEKPSHMVRHTLAVVLLFLILTISSAIGFAQVPRNPNSLATQVVDPTAPLKFMNLQNIYSWSTWGFNDRQNQAAFRANIPHDAFGLQNVMRVTTPYTTSQPSGLRGLDDVVMYNIFVYPEKRGSLALGGDIFLGTNKGPGINTFAIGPTLGIVMKKNKWLYGVFNQNFFSFGDIATTQLNPVLAYTFNDKLSVAYGNDAQYTLDWKKSRFVNAPLSIEINYISSIPHQTVRYFVNPQYNFVNETGARKWSINAGVGFIVK